MEQITQYSQFKDGLIFENENGERYLMGDNKQILVEIITGKTISLNDDYAFGALYKTTRINKSPVVRIYADYTLQEIVYDKNRSHSIWISKEELEKKLSLHQKWLNGDIDGEKLILKDKCLSDMILTGINLQGAELSNIDFSRTNLTDANFSETICWDIKARNANFSMCNFKGAKLNHCFFYDTNLKDADLTDVFMQDVALNGASLIGANLSGAKLYGISATETNFTNSNLVGTTFDNIPENAIGINLKNTRFKTLVNF